MTRPDALRLAEELERAKKWGCPADVIQSSADELRRLHAQRDALLEALRRLARIIDAMGDMPDAFIHPSPWRKLRCEEALAAARAAIAAAEGEKE